MRKVGLLVFVIVSLAELVGKLVYPDLNIFTKPLLMPSLIFYFLSVRTTKPRWHWLLIGGLFFSWIGDVLLISQESELYFMLGLSSFLMAHICYIILGVKARWVHNLNPLLLTQKIRYTATLLTAGIVLIWILAPGVGPLFIPIVVYAAVIVLMTITMLYRYGYTPMSSFGYMFGGAVIFMISDSILAINKFLQPIGYAGLWIMLTYILAQYFIVRGVLSHQDST